MDYILESFKKESFLNFALARCFKFRTKLRLPSLNLETSLCSQAFLGAVSLSK